MPITIAIDGHSSSGKSTLARDLAYRMGYVYIDSGAMYRAVTLHFLRLGVDLQREEQVSKALQTLQLEFMRLDDEQLIVLNGQIEREALRSMDVNRMVSPVATISKVRAALVARQQALGKLGGIVMDGRDIGTVVFPQAELKLFVSASIEVRVERRYLELLREGREAPRDQVKQNLLERDHIDSTRADSPLRKAVDAVAIDNSAITREEQLEMLYALARLRAQRYEKIRS